MLTDPIQTVDAAEFKGKHLHISMFARHIKPDFEELEKLYQLEFSKHLQEHLDRKQDDVLKSGRQLSKTTMNAVLEHRMFRFKEWFNDNVRQGFEQSEYGLLVYLHINRGSDKPPRLKLYLPTAPSLVLNPEEWNRFNVEVSIPAQCDAISVVVWSRGVNIVEVDHLAVVSHGDALERNPVDSGWGFGAVERIVGNLGVPITKSFSNLSFEQ